MLFFTLKQDRNIEQGINHKEEEKAQLKNAQLAK